MKFEKHLKDVIKTHLVNTQELTIGVTTYTQTFAGILFGPNGPKTEIMTFPPNTRWEVKDEGDGVISIETKGKGELIHNSLILADQLEVYGLEPRGE